MEPLDLAVLWVAALATSALSAVVGMAGGITLLAVMLLFLEPLVALPLHGAVQLVSNGSRACLQRHHLRWGILAHYGALLLPGGLLGLALVQSLPQTLTRATIGVFVLVATWAPGALLLGSHPERADPGRRFVALGGVVGLLNMTVGASGPLIAPFFLDLGLPRQALVGTKAACQTLGHLVKIALFGFAGFAFAAWLAPLGLLAIAVVIGTWLGTRLLDEVNELWFTRLYRTLLTLIALQLVLRELVAAFA